MEQNENIKKSNRNLLIILIVVLIACSMIGVGVILAIKGIDNSEKTEDKNKTEEKQEVENNDKQEETDNKEEIKQEEYEVIQYEIIKDEQNSTEALKINGKFLSLGGETYYYAGLSAEQIGDILIVIRCDAYCNAYLVDKDANLIGEVSFADNAALKIKANYYSSKIEGNDLYITSVTWAGDDEYTACHAPNDVIKYTEKFTYLGNKKFSASTVTESITGKDYMKQKNKDCKWYEEMIKREKFEKDAKEIVSKASYYFASLRGYEPTDDKNTEFIFAIYMVLQNKKYTKNNYDYIIDASEIDKILKEYFGISNYSHKSTSDGNIKYDANTKKYTSAFEFGIGPDGPEYEMIYVRTTGIDGSDDIIVTYQQKYKDGTGGLTFATRVSSQGNILYIKEYGKFINDWNKNIR